MRHHENSFERIIAATKRGPGVEQRLFLVADVNNKFDVNAVMLHDGQRKLGYVQAGEARKVKKILDSLSTSQCQVLVVTHQFVVSEGDFSWSTSLNVTAVGSIYERIARKFAQEGD